MNISFATLIGTMLGFALIFGAIAYGTENWYSFLNLEGALIVIGGSIANAFMSFQSRYVLQAFVAMLSMLKKPDATREGLNHDIVRLIKWAYISQAHGPVGLEKEVKTVKDPLLKFGLDLVVTGYKARQIRQMMETAIEAHYERVSSPVTVLRNMASTAPAFGMVGTLVGMVIMLQNVEADMSRIGAGLAIALLATLYGIVFARLLCLPAADKLLQKEEIKRFRNFMMLEGMTLLADQQKPRYMQDRLNSFLDPAIHFELDSFLKEHQPKTARA